MTDMRPKSLLIAGLLLFTVAWQGEANGQEDMLKGLREFHIVVEDLNDHAKKCGVTKDSLETSVRFVLQQSKVKLKPSDPLLPYVYVVAYVLEGGGLCSAYFGLSIAEPRIMHNRALLTAGMSHVTLHGLRRSFSNLAEWVEMPTGVVAQIMGHKPSATAERHYKHRPLDLLKLWHGKYEAWILEEAEVQFDAGKGAHGLRVVSGA